MAVTLLAAGVAHAESDLQLWTAAGVAWEATKKIEVTFEQHLRFDDDVSRVNAVMPEVGARYRLLPWLRLGAGYRYEYERNGNGELELRHKLHLATRARYDLADLRVQAELRWQDQIRPPEYNDRVRHTLREELGALYRGLKPIYPSASIELHHDVDRGDTIHLDKIWLTVGAGYVFGRHDLELFYRLEKPIFDDTDPTLHIVGTAYQIEL